MGRYMQRRRERMHRMSDAWRIENSLCSSATFKGRRFLAAERNYNASSRMHQATSQRTATMRARVPCIIACVYVRVCERVSLSSVVHISVVRCTLFRCLRLVGKARRIPRYIVRLRGRIRLYDHREEPSVGDWANIIREDAEKKILISGVVHMSWYMTSWCSGSHIW